MNLKIHILLITIANTTTCSEGGIKLFCRNETNENFQACLPSEIIKIIFNFCDVIEQCRFRLANKALYNAIFFDIEKPLSVDLNTNNNQFETTKTNTVCSLLESSKIYAKSFRFSNTTGTGLSLFFKSFHNNNIITTLNLNNNDIGSQGAQHLSDALKSNTTVNNLH